MQDDRAVNTTRWFWIFASVHLFFWTFLPTILRFTLPMDAMEGAVWGRHLAFGYDKNPFLNGWFTGWAIQIGGHSGWLVYFVSELFVLICFWAVWQLAKKILSPVHALISVFLLEAITSYNIDTIDFDDNVLELGLWALTILYFYQAIKRQKIRDWAFVGFFAGLALMAKYYTAVLLLPMFVFLCICKEHRISFKKPGLYIGLVIFLLIILPHFIWLFSHDFVTIHYAIGRVDVQITWLNHFLKPLKFTMPHLEACILPFLFFLIVLIGKKSGRIVSEHRLITPFQWEFLYFMGFGPFIVTILISLLTGVDLHSAWGQPLLSLWGIILVAWTQPAVTVKRFYVFISAVFFLMFFTFTAYSYSMLKAGNTSSANYPGQVIATKLTQEWHHRYHTKLSYVVGPRWEAGNVAFFSKDQPTVYMEADPIASFWINEKDVKAKGALIVWDGDKGYTDQFVHHLKGIKDRQIQTFRWMRDGKAKPVKLGVGFLPPKSCFK